MAIKEDCKHYVKKSGLVPRENLTPSETLVPSTSQPDCEFGKMIDGNCPEDCEFYEKKE